MNNYKENVSFQTLKFVMADFAEERPLIDYVWEVFCQQMMEANQQLVIREDSWQQDWLLAKYGKNVLGVGVHAYYLPPQNIYSFPFFDIDSAVAAISENPAIAINRSRSIFDWDTALESLLAGQTISAPYTLDRFFHVRSQIEEHGGVPMIQFNQILAWTNLVMGKMFTGILLSPVEENFEDLYYACGQRWSHIWNEKDLYEDSMNIPEMIQWKLNVFYSGELAEVGLINHPTRQGQPERWRDFWGWLSEPLSWEDALASVQIAAGLLSPVVISIFFRNIFKGAAEAVTLEHLLSVAIFRRWVLTLQVMGWLEKALQHRWRFVRPQDLICFAYSALRPHWPKRAFGLSHRSQDVKPIIKDLHLWDHFSFSIDATFVPQWETNTAMMWGLFSSVPGLIKVESPGYDQSIWCQREGELINYLEEEDDFIPGRYLINVDATLVTSLDKLAPDTEYGESTIFKRNRFPPPTMVFLLFPFEPWENQLLACVGAYRLLLSFIQDNSLTQNLCWQLANRLYPPTEITPPTNHPDGWRPFIHLFEACHQRWSDDPENFPLSLKPEFEEDERHKQISELNTNRIMDLSGGETNLEDVLAAFEWSQTLLPSQIGDRRYGDFVAVDFRQLTSAKWSSDAAYMTIRGVNRVMMPVPIWYIQNSNQRIEEWSGLGKFPIFTQHTHDQYEWIMEILLEPTWPSRFEEDSKFQFSKKLAAFCAKTNGRDNSYYQGRIF